MCPVAFRPGTKKAAQVHSNSPSDFATQIVTRPDLVELDLDQLSLVLYEAGVETYEYTIGTQINRPRRILYSEHPMEGIGFVKAAYDVNRKGEEYLGYLHFGLSDPATLKTFKKLMKDVATLQKLPLSESDRAMSLDYYETTYSIWTSSASEDDPSHVKEFPLTTIFGIDYMKH